MQSRVLAHFAAQTTRDCDVTSFRRVGEMLLFPGLKALKAQVVSAKCKAKEIIKLSMVVRDWSLITGATKWENRGSETFCAPPF